MSDDGPDSNHIISSLDICSADCQPNGEKKSVYEICLTLLPTPSPLKLNVLNERDTSQNINVKFEIHIQVFATQTMTHKQKMALNLTCFSFTASAPEMDTVPGHGRHCFVSADS